MLNKVTLIGNLGADPEVRAMPSGGSVTTIRLATTMRWKDKQTGERRESTEWHRVVFFNIGNYRLAEIACEYLKKGSQAYIEGRLQTRKWQAQDGQDRYTTEIIATELHMLGSRSGGTSEFVSEQHPTEHAAPPQNKPAYTQPTAPTAMPSVPPMPPAPPSYDDFDDDIPF